MTWVLVGLGLFFGLLTFGIGLLLAMPILGALPVAAMIYGIVGAVHAPWPRFSLLGRW